MIAYLEFLAIGMGKFPPFDASSAMLLVYSSRLATVSNARGIQTFYEPLAY